MNKRSALMNQNEEAMGLALFFFRFSVFNSIGKVFESKKNIFEGFTLFFYLVMKYKSNF